MEVQIISKHTGKRHQLNSQQRHLSPRALFPTGLEERVPAERPHGCLQPQTKQARRPGDAAAGRQPPRQAASPGRTPSSRPHGPRYAGQRRERSPRRGPAARAGPRGPKRSEEPAKTPPAPDGPSRPPVRPRGLGKTEGRGAPGRPRLSLPTPAAPHSRCGPGQAGPRRVWRGPAAAPDAPRSRPSPRKTPEAQPPPHKAITSSRRDGALPLAPPPPAPITSFPRDVTRAPR
ncbi:basic proline-rich protein-like [Chroicocephalus ridibundus]|uniref:basic proline-rich protein-like n=1 Tax=Chroicocephalus ridibundus TaxID=1192867 RepID=UPI002FDD8C80